MSEPNYISFWSYDHSVDALRVGWSVIMSVQTSSYTPTAQLQTTERPPYTLHTLRCGNTGDGMEWNGMEWNGTDRIGSGSRRAEGINETISVNAVTLGGIQT
jgi:hypothetical protein